MTRVLRKPARSKARQTVRETAGFCEDSSAGAEAPGAEGQALGGWLGGAPARLSCSTRDRRLRLVDPSASDTVSGGLCS